MARMVRVSFEWYVTRSGFDLRAVDIPTFLDVWVEHPHAIGRDGVKFQPV